MRRTKFSAVVALVLSLLFALGAASSVFAASSSTSKPAVTGEVAQAIEILSDIKWKAYSEEYSGGHFYSGGDIAVDMSSAVYEKANSDDVLSYEFDGNATIDGVKCVVTPESGTVTFKVTVPESGLYAVSWKYYDLVCKSTNIERTFRINGAVPFNEVRNLIMTKTWVDEYKYDNDGNIVFDKDGNGNDRRPSKAQASSWKDYDVCDPTGYYNGSFWFYFEAGENTVSIEGQKEPVAIADIVLKAYKPQMTYAEYKEYIHSKYQPAPADVSIMIQAEHPTSESDATLYAVTDRSSSITIPQDSAYSVLNAMGGTTWQTMGQWVEWTVEIPVSGIYKIDSRFIQNKIEGLYVSRRLYIDGTVPFAEANGVEFGYANAWQVASFGGNGEDFEFYFEKGTHTLRLEVVYGNLSTVVSDIRTALDEINKIYIKILQIAGSTPDSNTSYQFYARIPGDIIKMREIADELSRISDRLKEIGGGAGSNSATIDNVARVLRKMASDSEVQIAKQFQALKSYIGNLGTMLNQIGEQTLELDYIVIRSTENNVKLKADGNFLQNLGYEIARFWNSFFIDNSSFTSVTESGAEAISIDVWTVTSRERTQLIRTLVDEDFSAKNPNIAVNLKIVAAGTLLPATLSGNGPDVMMDVGQSDAINYAVRGAVLDVSGYDGFDELASRFHSSALAPLTVALGSSSGHKAVFGVPQTQSFEVMFYRKDIFADLGVNVPTNWDEFHLILSKILSRNYQVGMVVPSATMGFFVSLVYQNGGTLYKNAGTEIAFDSDETLTAFTNLCDFFNLYSCPIQYDAANRFRTGEMPLLIADYITFYNQFTIYATELKGLWGFTSIPGTVKEDGSVDYSNVSTISAMVIMKDAAPRGTAAAAFEYMKWWMEEDVQGEYANELVALLGPAGKYNTANFNAFNAMPWSASELRTLNNLYGHLKGYPEMPGGYIILRYVNFAFMETYNNGAVPSEALLSYIDSINGELSRKREELENGKDKSRSFFIPDDALSQ